MRKVQQEKKEAAIKAEKVFDRYTKAFGSPSKRSKFRN